MSDQHRSKLTSASKLVINLCILPGALAHTPVFSVILHDQHQRQHQPPHEPQPPYHVITHNQLERFAAKEHITPVQLITAWLCVVQTRAHFALPALMTAPSSQLAACRWLCGAVLLSRQKCHQGRCAAQTQPSARPDAAETALWCDLHCLPTECS